MAIGVKRSALGQRLLGNDPHTRIRVAMAAAATLLSVLCGSLALLLAYAGFASIPYTLIWICTTVLFNAAVLVCIRTGWTRRLADPALTQVQIRYAIVSNAVGYALLGEARGITPVILSLVLMFGIFSLSAREMVANLLFTVLSFAVAMGVVAWTDAPGYNPVLELAYGVMILLVVAGSTFVGMRIQHVRRRLQRQKHELGSAVERINHLATHDELTGLVNRRRMAELMEAERQRCQRGRRPLVLALLDLDHFKLVNDQHGHAAGDDVLCTFAACVQGVLRSTDVLARWGGEEFMLMLYEADARGAAQLLERVRASVEAMEIDAGGSLLRITVSIGQALGEPGEPVERTLERADQALYRAKEKGRNRVVQDGEVHEDTAHAAVGQWPYI